MDSNGQGTDHGWAGNTFILGGSIEGGKIFGKYPSSLLESGDVNLGNGGMLPTTSWDFFWNVISQCFGIIDEAELNKILPNRPNFLQGDHLLTKDMFK